MSYRIYIPLQSDQTMLRVVDAEPVGEGQFRIVGKVPAGEPLQFKRGEIVECSIQKLPSGAKDLVATRSVSADPEFKKTRVVYGVFGAIFGAFVGALMALMWDLSLESAGIGFLIGGPVFMLCSLRWGDQAWLFLSKLVRWDWRN